MRIGFFISFLLWTVIPHAQTVPLPNGHAHNDYVHKQPLYDALANGFTSIEIDVYLHQGQLKVAHMPFGLKNKKTIQEMYLDPIAKLIDANGNWVYRGSQTSVILMIDFKTEGVATYQKLKQILQGYSSILTVYSGDSVIRKGAIQILISGGSPVAELVKEDTAFVTVDADIKNMENKTVSKFCTRFSSPWQNYFTWLGVGAMAKKQQKKLYALVAEVHARGKQIRFYHIPDKEKVWRTLLHAGVDWINTNKLKQYRQFYERYQIKNATAGQ